MSQYSTNLTDKQWQVTKIILDSQQRKRKYPLREIMNAIMYMVKTGCQWRMLPKYFPPYNTVFEELVDTLQIINSLADLTGMGTSKKITFGAKNKAKLSAAQLAQVTDKGWVLG